MDFSAYNSFLPRLVAHAGGGYDGHTYTNSLEALNNSKNNNFRWIEIDFEWTTDNYLVLLHDWSFIFKLNYYNVPGRRSLYEYKKLKPRYGLTHLDLAELIAWLKNNQGIFIVTDIKKDNIRGLAKIAKEYPDIKNRFIPQIFSFSEYELVKKLGYQDIILALYKSNYRDKEIVDFAKNNILTAVSMPYLRGKTSLVKQLADIGVLVYVHTINDSEEIRAINKNGVYGFYTDFVKP